MITIDIWMLLAIVLGFGIIGIFIGASLVRGPRLR
jgi:hypothetical protein